MKRVVFAVIILVLILTSGVLENYYINRTFDKLDEDLKDLEQAITEQSDDALEKLKNLSRWWEDRRMYIELFAYSPDVRAFSVALGETEGSLECGDYQNALSKCHSLIVMGNNIRQLLDFNAEDII